jgi:ketosteroid isomerase-like protein
MSGCSEAFNRGDVGKLMECFDPEFVWDTPSVEFHGREQVVDFLAAHYFRSKSGAHFWMKVRDQQAVGNVIWTSYDFTIEGSGVHDSGRGMMICRKSEGQWHILSMHQSLDRPAAKCGQAE